jgi:hypothetical protein
VVSTLYKHRWNGPCSCHNGVCWSVGIAPFIWTLALVGYDRSASLSGRFTLGNNPSLFTEQQAGQAPDPDWAFWSRGKYIACAGKRTTIVASSRPWTSHCAVCDIAARNLPTEPHKRVSLSVLMAIRFANMKIFCKLMTFGGKQWGSWLQHCATRRKVAGSIPHGVNGSFHWLDPSYRTMNLGTTWSLRDICTRNISWG